MSYQFTEFDFSIAFSVPPTVRRAGRTAATQHPSSPSSRLRIPTVYSDLPPASDPYHGSIAGQNTTIRKLPTLFFPLFADDIPTRSNPSSR